MSYSQHGEEEAILRVFNGTERGEFLDVGAYDGKTFSNTRALAERGWSGVLVEPSAPAFKALLDLYGPEDGIDLVQACVGRERSLVEFWECGDAVGTTRLDHMEKWAKGGVNFRRVFVPQITVGDLLAQLPGPYDFVNVDVEGGNWEVLEDLPLDCGWPRCLCVEHDGRIVEMTERGKQHGLTEVAYLDGNNLILARP